jgi:hypothetical protein
MHKFELSVYKGIWEDKNVITQILQNPDLIRANHTFWREDFSVDPNITETNAEGEAVFTSRMRAIDTGVLMDMRAPLGDSIPEDVKGMEAYQGTIQEFISKGYVETAEMRDYKRRLFDEIGDATLVRRFAEDVLQPRIDSANQTLSYMAAQLISTGKIIYNVGVGMKGSILKAAIPAENFLKAGAEAWSSPTAKLIDQMRKIEDDFRDKTGLAIPMQWKITREMFNQVFLQNPQVQDWIKTMYLVETGQVGLDTGNLTGLVVNEDTFNKYIVKVQGLSPIKIVDEKSKDYNGDTVYGWAKGIAVYCPAGKLGLVRRTTIADLRLFSNEYTNPNTTFTFGSALDGCAFVRNSIVPNGVLKEWHSDLVLAATPTLDEFLYHYIVDTTRAD